MIFLCKWGFIKRTPQFKIYSESFPPFSISPFEWTDKASRNSKKVLKRKGGKKAEREKERERGREGEKERERGRERERKVVFYFSFLMFMICCLIYKLWSKREKKGECVHANPRRETAFYSPSTQKATLCLLSYIALLGSFLALLSLSLSLHSVITFCLNPILFPTTHFDHILSLSPPKTQKHKYTILVYLVYDYDNLYCSCIP